MNDKQWYNTEIIDVDSRLAEGFGGVKHKTIGFGDSEFIKVHTNKLKDLGFQLAKGYNLAYIPDSGNHEFSSYDELTSGLVNKLAGHEKHLAHAFRGANVRAIGFTDIVDWGDDGKDEANERAALLGLENACLENRLVNFNGESAVMPGRFEHATITGTGFYAVYNVEPGTYIIEAEGRKIPVIIADTEGMIVYVCCDGTGSKPDENVERIFMPLDSTMDLIAMSKDDAAKYRVSRDLGLAATIDLALGHGAEGNELETLLSAYSHALQNAKTSFPSMGPFILNHTDTTGVLRGYGKAHINPNSTSVTLLTEKDFFEPPEAKEGNSLYVIIMPYANLQRHINMTFCFPSTLKSNGNSQIRKDFPTIFGSDFHLHPQGRLYTLMAAQGTNVLYEPMQESLKTGASQVSHITGGGLDKKCAREIGRYGLGGRFHIPYDLNPVHMLLRDHNEFTATEMANKFALFEGWVAVSDAYAKEVGNAWRKRGFLFEKAGTIEKTDTSTFTFASMPGEEATFMYNKK